MAHRNLHKEDFVPTDDGQYQVEYKKAEIGEGSNLTIEKKMKMEVMRLYRL